MDYQIHSSLGAKKFETFLAQEIPYMEFLCDNISATGDIMGVEYGEFKGHKMIILKKDETDQYPFQFGKAKAKLIVEHFKDIEKFAEDE